MTSTTSSNSPLSFRTTRGFTSIYLWSLKKRMGMSILYGILSFIAMPMILWLSLNYQDSPKDIVYSVLKVVFPVLVIPLTLLFTLLISCMMFSFMHNKRSVDLFYSLPVTRSEMFLGRYFGGLTLIYIPYTVVCLLSVLTCVLCGLSSARTEEFVQKILWMALCIAASYTFSVVISICSGTTADAVISILFISLSYPAAVFLLASLLTSMLPGFDFASVITPVSLTAFTPYASAFAPYVVTVKWTFLLYWLVFVITAFIAAYKLYRRRKSEAAEITVAFAAPTVVIRIMATLSAAIGMGYIFIEMIGKNHTVFWLGALVGSFAANLILEYIYSKNFKSFKKSLAYYCGMLAFLLVFYVVAASGCFGYSNRIPTADSVESVHISGDSLRPNLKYYISGDKMDATLNSPASVESVVQFNQSLMNYIRRDPDKFAPSLSDSIGGTAISFTYYLKDGRSFTRTISINDWLFYNYDEAPDLKAQFNRITESEEFKKSAYTIFSAEVSKLSEISVSAGANSGDYTPTESQKSAFLDALRADILADTQDELDGTDSINAKTNELSVSLKYGKIAKRPGEIGKAEEYEIIEYYSIYSSYSNTLGVLNRFGWLPENKTNNSTAEESAPAA